MELTRAQRSLIRSLHTRHGRRKSGMCIVEGVRAVSELIAADAALAQFIVVSGAGLLPDGYAGAVYQVSESVFGELSATVNSQGVLAVCRTPEYTGADVPVNDAFIVALDRVADPGNFGTICRTAKAAGLTELWITAGTVDPFGDKAVRSALGAQFSMNIRLFDDLKAMRDFGASRNYGPLWLTDPHQGENCFTAERLYDRSILVIGNEAGGVAELADAPRVTIPMPGNFESLNAAQAATIFIFGYVRMLSCRK